MARFEDIYVFHIYILSCFANVVLCFDTELSWILNGVLCVLNFEFEECMGNWRWEQNSNKHVPTTVLTLKQETETQNSNAKQKHHNTKHGRTKPKI